jgi:hypothetical protein
MKNINCDDGDNFHHTRAKKANGTIYVDHPAITIVEGMTKAFVSGDENKVAGYLADDFKSFDGTDKDDKGAIKLLLRSVKTGR